MIPGVRWKPHALCLSLAMLSGGCTAPATPTSRLLGLGDPCTPEEVCREPLDCLEGTCEPTGEAALGETCVLSLDCQAGLYCAAGVCDTAGEVGEGGICESISDCQQDLYCAFEGFGGTCRQAGRTDLDEDCAEASACAGGLVCDPTVGTCQQSYGAPVGNACERDVDCTPEVGIFCLEDGTCGGYGPDGFPFVPWGGHRRLRGEQPPGRRLSDPLRPRGQPERRRLLPAPVPQRHPARGQPHRPERPPHPDPQRRAHRSLRPLPRGDRSRTGGRLWPQPERVHALLGAAQVLRLRVRRRRQLRGGLHGPGLPGARPLRRGSDPRRRRRLLQHALQRRQLPLGGQHRPQQLHLLELARGDPGAELALEGGPHLLRLRALPDPGRR